MIYYIFYICYINIYIYYFFYWFTYTLYLIGSISLFCCFHFIFSVIISYNLCLHFSEFKFKFEPCANFTLKLYCNLKITNLESISLYFSRFFSLHIHIQCLFEKWESCYTNGFVTQFPQFKYVKNKNNFEVNKYSLLYNIAFWKFFVLYWSIACFLYFHLIRKFFFFNFLFCIGL